MGCIYSRNELDFLIPPHYPSAVGAKDLIVYRQSVAISSNNAVKQLEISQEMISTDSESQSINADFNFEYEYKEEKEDVTKDKIRIAAYATYVFYSKFLYIMCNMPKSTPECLLPDPMFDTRTENSMQRISVFGDGTEMLQESFTSRLIYKGPYRDLFNYVSQRRDTAYAVYVDDGLSDSEEQYFHRWYCDIFEGVWRHLSAFFEWSEYFGKAQSPKHMVDIDHETSDSTNSEISNITKKVPYNKSLPKIPPTKITKGFSIFNKKRQYSPNTIMNISLNETIAQNKYPIFSNNGLWYQRQLEMKSSPSFRRSRMWQMEMSNKQRQSGSKR